MGQRHQAFLIAKVVPHGETKAKYRCIAAYHHQWCAGEQRFRATRRCMTLVKQPENAQIIREEIRAIHGRYGRHRGKPAIPATPCPFSASLLGMSWDTDLGSDRSYTSGLTFENSLLHAGMGSWDGDNNTGITVIDVTDPESPAYCFVHQGYGHREKYISWARKPTVRITPHSKANASDVDSSEDESQGVADALSALMDSAGLEEERGLTLEALAEAWPREYNCKRKSEESSMETETTTSEPKHISRVDSLADIALRSIVAQVIDSGNSASLEETVWLPGRAQMIHTLLRDQSPFPDTGLPLLQAVFQHEASTASRIDLSRIDLSDGQLMSVALPHFSASCSMLNLSRMPRVTVAALRQLLEGLPQLRRVILMNCPGIPSSDLVDFLTKQPQLFYPLEAVMHPAFLGVSKPLPCRWNAAITFLSVYSRTTFPMLRGVSLPYFSPSNVVYALINYLSAMPPIDKYSAWSNFQNNSGTAMAAAFTAAAKAPDTFWNERTVVNVPYFDVDLLLPKEGHWLFLMKPNIYYSTAAFAHGWAFIRVLPGYTDSSEVYKGNNAPNEDDEGESSSEVDPATPGEPIQWKQISSEDFDREILGCPLLPAFEVHDLRGFARICAEEGRPPVPEDALSRAEELLQGLTKAHKDDHTGFTRCNLMDRDFAIHVLKEIEFGKQELLREQNRIRGSRRG